MPVFSGFSGGLTKFIGPTGGYLFGFFGMVLIAGIVIDRYPNHKLYTIVGMVLGMLFCYILGTIWLSIEVHMSIKEALFVGVIPFVLGDFIKICILSFLGPLMQKKLKKSGVFLEIR